MDSLARYHHVEGEIVLVERLRARIEERTHKLREC